MDAALPSGSEALFPVLLGQDPASLAALFAGDPARAAFWVQTAAEQGVAEAQARLGQMRLDGLGASQDPAAAIGWFRRAAEQGDADGCNMLGRCLENGWGAKPDPAEAVRWYRRAADAGHAWAQYNLGHMLLGGLGVERDAAEALAWYRRSADQGHARAMNLVGRCLEHGWGAAADSQSARDWYRRSAEGGYFRGQYNWATVLIRERRYEEAALWLERAASAGTAGVRRAIADLLDRVAGDASLSRLRGRLDGGPVLSAPR